MGKERLVREALSLAGVLALVLAACQGSEPSVFPVLVCLDGDRDGLCLGRLSDPANPDSIFPGSVEVRDFNNPAVVVAQGTPDERGFVWFDASLIPEKPVFTGAAPGCWVAAQEGIEFSIETSPGVWETDIPGAMLAIAPVPCSLPTPADGQSGL